MKVTLCGHSEIHDHKAVRRWLNEIADDVAAELKADKLYEAAHRRQTVRNKAQYSLDCDDGIE